MKTIGLLIILATLSACSGGESDPSAPVVPPTPAAVAHQDNIVFVGDSITQNWMGGAPAYPSPTLREYVAREVNLGISGQTTSQMLARFADALSYHPVVVVILGGTNDIAFDEAMSTDSIAEIARRASAAGARVVICTVPPSHLESVATAFHGRAENDARIARFNSDLRMLAASYGYKLADYHAALVRVDGEQDPALFQPDQMHPSADGYRAMWPVLQAALH